MDTLAKKIRQRSETPYQAIAKKHNTNAEYVGKIARAERIPIRGKGLQILNELKKITNNK
ncbi:XRE family transcriptional regulator [Chryseobacterium indologenes]|uniref:XRE family transcriptional regulator n=1 Tax=Chryseobacterium indologenes TaxID=253 RepID=A0AAD1DV89_CHRID|nr:XRE family transcriptional regulator [Chryseobacterium indologenes]AZB17608.1 XRE family transcriptional regulator [Chryseobacterium indologenes]